MRVTIKGQVTIPVKVREKLGIFPGTEVEFVLRGDSASLVKSKRNNGRPTRGELAISLLAGKATDKSRSTDQILKLTRGED
jgi:AbrB family looped-hinge helix DNA binding protein